MHALTLHDWPAADGTSVTHAFTFAGTWDECPPEQFAQAVLARATPKEHGGVRFHLLRMLGAVPSTLMERTTAEQFTRLVDVPAEFGEFGQPIAPARQELRLLPELDWVWAAPHLVASKLPALAHAGVQWQGPDDNLSHMTLDQWRWCVKLLKHFREETNDAQRDAHLNNLLGALYQPKYTGLSDHAIIKQFERFTTHPQSVVLRPLIEAWKFEHEPGRELDLRQRIVLGIRGPAAPPWSSECVEEYAALLATLPLETRLAAAFNFEAMNAVLPRQYKRTFERGDGPTSPQGILDISYDVARGGTLGDYEKVNTLLLHTVLAYMENSLFHDERAVAEAPSEPGDGIGNFSQRS